MTVSSHLRLVAVVATVAALALALVGCSGSSGTVVRQNVSERGSWSPASTRIAFAAPGATGLLYVWTMDETGGSMALITATQDTANPTSEGGWQPSYNPDGSRIAIVSQRGGTPAVFQIDGTTGDIGLLQRVTPETGAGRDEMPSWRPDGLGLVYASTRRANNYDIRSIGADGAGLADVIATPAEEKWPCYNPGNADQVAFQSDAEGTTGIYIITLSTGAVVNLTAGSPYRNEAPSWSPDGAWIAFHSDRGGTFDIWKIRPDGTGLTQLTSDARADGYPFWKSDSGLIGFTRNREVWSMAPDGSDQTQLTERPI